MNVLRSLNKLKILSRNSSTLTQAQTEKWDLYSAVSLERIPIITKEYNDIEKKISNILSELEFERSHKSDFEIRIIQDDKRDKAIKDGKITVQEIDTAPQQSARDFLEVCTEELKSFNLAPRIIENNLKSIDRELDKRLLLIIEDKIGNKKQWILPQGKHLENENSLRQTAERVLKEKIGDKVKTKFLGNAPCGFYKYKYPKNAQNESVGAKIFFFKAQLINGNIDEKICHNFQWATKKQMDILHVDYKKSIEMFLIDEE